MKTLQEGLKGVLLEVKVNGHLAHTFLDEASTTQWENILLAKNMNWQQTARPRCRADFHCWFITDKFSTVVQLYDSLWHQFLVNKVHNLSTCATNTAGENDPEITISIRPTEHSRITSRQEMQKNSLSTANHQTRKPKGTGLQSQRQSRLPCNSTGNFEGNSFQELKSFRRKGKRMFFQPQVWPFPSRNKNALLSSVLVPTGMNLMELSALKRHWSNDLET